MLFNTHLQVAFVVIATMSLHVTAYAPSNQGAYWLSSPSSYHHRQSNLDHYPHHSDVYGYRDHDVQDRHHCRHHHHHHHHHHPTSEHPHHDLEDFRDEWNHNPEGNYEYDDEDSFIVDYLEARGLKDQLKKLNPIKKTPKGQGYGKLTGDGEGSSSGKAAKDDDSTKGIPPSSPKKGSSSLPGSSKKGGK
ncbi:hypothetical protein ABKN59_011612 [Abortiporus biennis]